MCELASSRKSCSSLPIVSTLDKILKGERVRRKTLAKILKQAPIVGHKRETN
jgi:predicted transcriptional regulator